jgi:hypothetical protein
LKKSKKRCAGLTAAELTAFRQWFTAFDAEAWDRQLERDSVSGTLADLARKSKCDHEGGESTEV